MTIADIIEREYAEQLRIVRQEPDDYGLARRAPRPVRYSWRQGDVSTAEYVWEDRPDLQEPVRRMGGQTGLNANGMHYAFRMSDGSLVIVRRKR